MQYEKSLMAQWDEYARVKTAMEEGKEKGKEEGIKERNELFVKNLLAAGQFTIGQIANYACVTEEFVRKVKKSMK
jgi:predicted transposase YdaD